MKLQKFTPGILALLLMTSCHLFQSSELQRAVSQTRAVEKSKNGSPLLAVHNLLVKRGIEHKLVKFRYDVYARPAVAPVGDADFFRGQTPVALPMTRRYVRERTGIIYRDDSDKLDPWWYIDGKVWKPIWVTNYSVAEQVSFAMRRQVELLRVQEFNRAVEGMSKDAGTIGKVSAESYWQARFRRMHGTDFDPTSPLDQKKMRSLHAM